MYNFLKRTVFQIFCFSIGAVAVEPVSVIWELNSLSSIGGNSVVVKGTPKTVETEIGQAVQFSKSPDQLLVNNNPLGTATEWTIETIIRPDDIGSESDLKEPRYLHIQDPADDTRRITMEMRVSNKKWYFDAFIKSSVNDRTLKSDKLTHDVDKWYNVAITYAGGTFTTYINGVQELTGTVTYETISSKGVVSLGCRMNTINYFKGAIRKIIITNAALTPDKFDKSYLGTTQVFKLHTFQANAASTRAAASTIMLDCRSLPIHAFTLNGRVVSMHSRLSGISSLLLVREGTR